MRRADWGLGVLLGVGAGLLFAATAQERFWSDGSGLVEFFATGTGQAYYHVLYLPLCRLLGAVLGEDPLVVPRALSIISGAIAVGGTFLLGRANGLERGRATAASLLLGATPCVWFYSTTVEVHAVHMAAVVVGACVVLFAPWKSLGLSAALCAATVPLLYGSHITAVLLVPGWLALARHARLRRGLPFGLRETLVVGAALGLATLLSVAGANSLRGLGFTLDTSQVRTQIGAFFQPASAWSMVLEGWLLPCLLLVPLAAFALVRGRIDASERLALAALLVPSTVFFLVWGVAEKGAYFVGTAPIMALAAARAFPPAGASRGSLTVPLLALAIAVQAAVAWPYRTNFDQGFEMATRAEAVRGAIGDEGLLISTGDWAIDIGILLPGVHEERWVDILAGAAVAGHSPEEVAPAVHAIAPAVAAGPVAIDLSHRTWRGPIRMELMQPYYDAIEAELERTFDTTVIDHESWPMMIVKPKGGG